MVEDDTASTETLNAALTRTEDALTYGSYAAALIIGTVLLYRRDNN